MDAVALAAVGVSLVSVIATSVIAVRSQRGERTAAERERRWQLSTEFRQDQTELIESVLMDVTDLLDHVYSVEEHWRFGEPASGVDRGIGPGASPGSELAPSAFYGVDISEFHRLRHRIRIRAFRLTAPDLRAGLLRFAEEANQFLGFHSLEEGAEMRRHLQHESDTLLELGGLTARDLFDAKKTSGRDG